MPLEAGSPEADCSYRSPKKLVICDRSNHAVEQTIVSRIYDNSPTQLRLR